MTQRPLIAAGTALGIGMGGFVDGILFHQILQLHNMLSAKIPPASVVNIETNMVWDGLFHSLTWTVTAAGIALLWHAGRERATAWSGAVLLGSMLMGWGVFNMVEGLLDHYLLGVHHVVERLGFSIYDHVFLASGVLLVLAGQSMIKAGERSQRM